MARADSKSHLKYQPVMRPRESLLLLVVVVPQAALSNPTPTLSGPCNSAGTPASRSIVANHKAKRRGGEGYSSQRSAWAVGGYSAVSPGSIVGRRRHVRGHGSA